MYRLRPFTQADWPILEQMHASRGFDFELPKRLEEHVVVEDEETGEVVQIMATRETREAYVWMNPNWKTPSLRWKAFAECHNTLVAEMFKKGIRDVHIWIHPSIEKSFGRRLSRKLHWLKTKWQSYVLYTGA